MLQTPNSSTDVNPPTLFPNPQPLVQLPPEAPLLGLLPKAVHEMDDAELRKHLEDSRALRVNHLTFRSKLSAEAEAEDALDQAVGISKPARAPKEKKPLAGLEDLGLF